MKTKLILIMILALLMPIGYAYTWDGNNDNTDRLSSGQSSVFSPGYLNAAKQQAYETIKQSNQSKSWWDNLVDKVKNKMSNKVEEAANTKVTVEVKKKVSGGAPGSVTIASRLIVVPSGLVSPPGSPSIVTVGATLPTVTVRLSLVTARSSSVTVTVTV